MTCPLCGNPVPIYGCVLWCDSCIEECLASGKSVDDFVEEKRGENSVR